MLLQFSQFEILFETTCVSNGTTKLFFLIHLKTTNFLKFFSTNWIVENLKLFPLFSMLLCLKELSWFSFAFFRRSFQWPLYVISMKLTLLLLFFDALIIITADYMLKNYNCWFSYNWKSDFPELIISDMNVKPE